MTGPLRAVANALIITPLSFIDKRVHDYTPLKNYQTITFVVNLALAAIDTAFSRPLLTRVIRLFEIRNISAPSMKLLMSLSFFVAYSLLDKTDSARIAINDPSLLPPRNPQCSAPTIPSFVPETPSAKEKRIRAHIEDCLEKQIFSFLNDYDSISWELVLAAGKSVAEKKRCSPKEIFDQLDAHIGISLFWRAVNCGVPEKYDIARGLLGLDVDPNKKSDDFIFACAGETMSGSDFLFVLKLIKNQQLNTDSIKVIKDAWNNERRKKAEYFNSTLSLTGWRSAGWESKEALSAYVEETFDANGTWK